MKFRVWVNGEEIEISEARVSKYPLNHVWHGNQRNILQTEIAYFAGFDISSRTTVKVRVLNCGIEKAEIRPLEKHIPFEVSGNKISFELTQPGQFTVEINGYHECLALFADPPFEYCRREDDIVFSKGIHHAGLIVPKSNSRIILERGAVVYGTVYAKDCENVQVIGRGVLDSSPYRRNNDYNGDDGHEVTDALKNLDLTERDIQYASMFNAYNCKNLTIDGITFVDAPLWTLILRNGCENVIINNIKIIGQWRYNSDGVDICNSYNVVLQNSFIRSFDDSVVIRAPYLDGESGGCSGITVKNNVLWCDCGKNLEIWSGCCDSVIENILFADNYLIHVQCIAISIDTWFGSDSIIVRNVLYDGICVEHDEDHLPMQYNDCDNAEYEYPHEINYSDMSLVRIAVGTLGKNLGNQQFDTTVDVSGFDIRYKNICIRNLKSTIELPTPYFVSDEKLSELSDISINGYDYKEFCE